MVRYVSIKCKYLSPIKTLPPSSTIEDDRIGIPQVNSSLLIRFVTAHWDAYDLTSNDCNYFFCFTRTTLFVIVVAVITALLYQYVSNYNTVPFVRRCANCTALHAVRSCANISRLVTSIGQTLDRSNHPSVEAKSRSRTQVPRIALIKLLA